MAAYGKAAAILYAESSFTNTDIRPFKADVFEDFLFAPEETFDKIIQNPNEHYPCKHRPRERLMLPLHRLNLNEDNTKMYMENNMWGVDGFDDPRVGTNGWFFGTKVKHCVKFHDQLSEEQFRKQKA